MWSYIFFAVIFSCMTTWISEMTLRMIWVIVLLFWVFYSIQSDQIEFIVSSILFDFEMSSLMMSQKSALRKINFMIVFHVEWSAFSFNLMNCLSWITLNVDNMLCSNHSHDNLTASSSLFCSHDDELLTQKFVV